MPVSTNRAHTALMRCCSAGMQLCTHGMLPLEQHIAQAKKRGKKMLFHNETEQSSFKVIAALAEPKAQKE